MERRSEEEEAGEGTSRLTVMLWKDRSTGSLVMKKKKKKKKKRKKCADWINFTDTG